jgi:hypothetical protein
VEVIDVIYCIVMIVFFISIFTSIYFEKYTKIVPAPTLSYVRRKALKLIPPNFKREGQYNILDLGSGWGGILIALSKLFPQSKITGYELSPFPYIISSLRIYFNKKNIDILREDFFDKDISSADIIFCYLSPYHMEKLKEKFATLPEGKCIISCSFPIKGWKADKQDEINSFFIKIPIFRYITGTT